MNDTLDNIAKKANSVRNIIIAGGAILTVVLSAVHFYDQVGDNKEKVLEVEKLLLETNTDFSESIEDLEDEIKEMRIENDQMRDDIHIVSCFVRHNGNEDARKNCELEGI